MKEAGTKATGTEKVQNSIRMAIRSIQANGWRMSSKAIRLVSKNELQYVIVI